MLNLIKMDIHRLFHTKSFKVAIIFSAILPFVGIAVVSGLLLIFQEMMKSPENAQALAAFPLFGWLTNGVTLPEIVLTGFNVLSLIVSTVLTAIFINSEQETGYIKNIAGQLSNRGTMIVSKICTIAVINLVIFAIYTGISSLACMLFLQFVLKSGSLTPLLTTLAVKFLLYMAIDAIILFICTLTKSKALSVAIGVIFGIGISGFSYSILGNILNLVFKTTNINLSFFTPDGMNSILAINSEADIIIKAIIVAVIYIAGFMIASSIVIKKRDVR